MPRLPVISLDYIGGLFDGEGSVTIQRRTRKDRDNVSYVPRLALSNAHKGVIDTLVATFGGSVHCYDRKTQLRGRYKLYDWIVSSKKAYEAAKLLADHTIIKQAELENLIEFVERTDSFGRMARTAGRQGDKEKAAIIMARSNEIAEEHIYNQTMLREAVRTRI